MPNPPLDPYGRSIPPTPGATMIVDSAGLRYPLRSTLKTTLTVTDSPDTGETILAVPGVAGNAAALAFLAAPTLSAESALLDPAVRASILSRGEGMIAQNFERNVFMSSSIIVDGTAYFVAVPLLAGDVISNISIVILTLGATVTLSKVGLYSAAGARLAISADQGASWESVGLKTIAMVAPYTVLANGLYYVSVIAKATVTVPRPASSANGTTAATYGTAVGAGSLPFGTMTAQTDLPATATIVTGAPFIFWTGLS